MIQQICRRPLTRNSGFEPNAVHIRILVDKVAQVFAEYVYLILLSYSSPCLRSILQCYLVGGTFETTVLSCEL
jgi:hypothetical protein